MNTEIGRRQALLAIAGGALGARTGFRPRFTENPDQLAGGGMKPEPVSVNWRLAADEKMTKIIRQGTTVAVDKWDGYPAARERLISFLAQAKPSNPVVISGD